MELRRLYTYDAVSSLNHESEELCRDHHSRQAAVQSLNEIAQNYCSVVVDGSILIRCIILRTIYNVLHKLKCEA